MGYFSNGCEGEDYEARYCNRCVHQKPDGPGCAVWLAHVLHNYRQTDEQKEILDLLIPRTANGVWNAECAMFHAKAED